MTHEENVHFGKEVVLFSTLYNLIMLFLMKVEVSESALWNKCWIKIFWHLKFSCLLEYSQQIWVATTLIKLFHVLIEHSRKCSRKLLLESF